MPLYQAVLLSADPMSPPGLLPDAVRPWAAVCIGNVPQAATPLRSTRRGKERLDLQQALEALAASPDLRAHSHGTGISHVPVYVPLQADEEARPPGQVLLLSPARPKMRDRPDFEGKTGRFH